MKTIATAQAVFRANDRDGNGKQDYWRGDISGLYALRHKDQRIKLIDIAIAGADNRPLQDISEYTLPGAKAGYWYRALRFADEVTPEGDRFAVCAFPDAYGGSGTWTFIVSEDNKIFKKDLGHGHGLDVFPSDLVAEGWSILN